MVPVLPNGLFISEFLGDNAGGSAFDTDGDGTANKADEFVEIQSISGDIVDLSSIQLWSAQRGLLFDFTAGETLAPGATATVVGEYSGAVPAGFYDAGLPDNNSNDGLLEDGEATSFDTLYLVDTVTGDFTAIAYGEPPVVQPLPPGFPGTNDLGREEINTGLPNGTAVFRAADGTLTTGTPTPGTPNAVCFAAGTMIATPDGARAVEALAPGDMVLTQDHGAQPVRWLGQITLSARELRRAPHLAPVRFAAGSLGGGLPEQDLFLSPQHRVLMQSRVTERMIGAAGALVPAIKLVGLPGIAKVPLEELPDGVAYYHLLLDAHELVLAHGTPTETLLLGTQAREMLPPESVAEIAALLPHAEEDAPIWSDPAEARPARDLPRGRKLARMIDRHKANARPPLESLDRSNV